MKNFSLFRKRKPIWVALLFVLLTTTGYSQELLNRANKGGRLKAEFSFRKVVCAEGITAKPVSDSKLLTDNQILEAFYAFCDAKINQSIRERITAKAILV